jgi:hypothetical protein
LFLISWYIWKNYWLGVKHQSLIHLLFCRLQSQVEDHHQRENKIYLSYWHIYTSTSAIGIFIQVHQLLTCLYKYISYWHIYTSTSACPFTLCRGFFTPKIVGTFYMQGYKVKEKTAIVPPVSKLSGHPAFWVNRLSSEALYPDV